MVEICTQSGNRLQDLIETQIRSNLSHLSSKEILIKPNWVIHETKAEYPINTLITSPAIIEAVILACNKVFPDFNQITIADCPLQSADWPLLCKQSGLSEVIDRMQRQFGDRVRFIDLRKEVFKVGKNYVFIIDNETQHGDPLGYREIELRNKSHLEPIAQTHRFSIVDHDDTVAKEFHRSGDHRYLITQTCLNADLIINLPKWKTHSKTGITGALKNLVGISGDKAYLPHFRSGSPRWGGDEYGDDDRWMAWLAVSVKKLVWRRSSLGYVILRPIGEIVKYIYEKVRGSNKKRNQASGMYIGGGGWYGNTTIWRMIYDLNMVAQCVDKQGVLHDQPQRGYFCIVDGLKAGEGEGPLQPLTRELDCLVFGSDPFEIDTALSWLMGYNPEIIPLLSEHKSYMGSLWGSFDFNDLKVSVNGKVTNLMAVEKNYKFLPPRGWVGHIERT